MGGVKRFVLIVYALAAALCLAALALPWIGPFQQEATSLMDNDYYYLAMQVVLAITVAGVLVTLLRALFTPRRRKTVVIAKEGGDQITVTTAAISSQATHVVEDQGKLVAEKVRVTAKGRGNVSVDVRVRPRHTVDVSQEGRRLHESLESGLSTICGDRVRHINLEFVEAEQPIAAQDVTIENLEIPASVYERASLAESETMQASDITVPMGGTATSASAEADAVEMRADEGEVA